MAYLIATAVTRTVCITGKRMSVCNMVFFTVLFGESVRLSLVVSLIVFLDAALRVF